MHANNILAAKILLVDDREVNLMLLRRMLGDAGYTCLSSTGSGKAVGDLHRTNRYDLIVLDLMMPDMNGFDVMQELQAIDPEDYLPVLALTAHPGHKLHALQAGAKDFISKPFELPELLMRVHNMLEVRLMHLAAREHGKQLLALALHDPLTGLANRRLLDDRMAMALVHARRIRSAMAVIYLDLDGFKGINDSLGHGTGDKLLQMVAQRLVTTVREEDTVARAGGDEFIIALWQVDGANHADLVAGKIITAVAKPYDIDGAVVHVSASAGVSTYPLHAADTESLVSSADRALRQAKQAGKNVHCMATPMAGTPANRSLPDTSINHPTPLPVA